VDRRLDRVWKEAVMLLDRDPRTSGDPPFELGGLALRTGLAPHPFSQAPFPS